MTEHPFFSIVIPTYARARQLAACLDALAAVDFAHDHFEVVVSDDGSPESPTRLVAAVRDRLAVQLVRGAHGGPAMARNRGAAHARGRYLVFIDDDCLPTPGWLAALEQRFAAAPKILIGGGIENALPTNPFSTATQLIVTCVYEYHAGRAAGIHFFNTSNLAVPAAQFAELGGFSEAFPIAAGEDYDFCHRWHHAGYDTAYAPDVLVRHAHALTLRSFCRQHFNYGRGLFRFRRRIAERTQARWLEPESAGFYFNLLRYPLTRGEGKRGLLNASLVALSQAATAVGVAMEAAVAIVGASSRTMSTHS